MSATDYSPSFYDTIAHGARTAAGLVVPLILGRHPVSSVIDVGCGQGWWGVEFERAACMVTGLDGAHVPGRQLDTFIEHDLMDPMPELGRFDMAVCLEVAEHLPEERAASFVAELCALAPVIVFSAATPHQPGAGHVNCQWPSWWADLFAVHGFKVDGSLRWKIWGDDRIEPWYRQNLLIAAPKARRSEPLDVIHPVIHGWGR